MAGVLIVAEASGEQLSGSTLELASVGARLAKEMGTPVQALLAGKGLDGIAGSLGAHGVQTVYLAQADSPSPPSTEWVLAAARQAVEKAQPSVVLLSHAAGGRDLAPALAFALAAGIVTDCTQLRLEGGSLIATKPVYGGSALAELAIKTPVQVATIRPRAFEAAPTGEGTATVEPIVVTVPDARVQVIEEIRAESTTGPRLKDAKVVVAGGRGLGGPENWKYVEELAQALGGAVGATRAVTDAGWVAPSLQVGLTGVSIAPDLYVTVGISGAVQHVAGISGARNVVAINRDADANIFKYARYGVAGDWKQVLPAFIARLKELRG